MSTTPVVSIRRLSVQASTNTKERGNLTALEQYVRPFVWHLLPVQLFSRDALFRVGAGLYRRQRGRFTTSPHARRRPLRRLVNLGTRRPSGEEANPASLAVLPCVCRLRTGGGAHFCGHVRWRSRLLPCRPLRFKDTSIGSGWATPPSLAHQTDQQTSITPFPVAGATSPGVLSRGAGRPDRAGWVGCERSWRCVALWWH